MYSSKNIKEKRRIGSCSSAICPKEKVWQPIIRSESVTYEETSPNSQINVYKLSDFYNEEVIGEGFFGIVTKVC